MQALLRLVNEWDPLAEIDLHVTDGAKFEHDVSIEVEPLQSGDAELAVAGREFRDAVIARLAEQGSLPLDFYPSLAHRDDPASGFIDDVSPPRFSHGYFVLRNRFGMLVETHSWKDYPTRVRVTHNTILAVLEQIAEHGKRWLELAHAADERAGRLGGTEVPLAYDATERERIIEFRGYDYERTESDVSGDLMTRYDEAGDLARAAAGRGRTGRDRHGAAGRLRHPAGVRPRDCREAPSTRHRIPDSCVRHC
jgi:hypothetical protein